MAQTAGNIYAKEVMYDKSFSGGDISGSNTVSSRMGITTDETKSGIIGTVTRSVLSINFVIRY